MDFITSLLTEWGYLALFIIMALENMNIPIPSEIVLGFAGFLVFKGV
ncbi:DedA family protein, partial [Allisonella histaminiformans]|nr:DedA family protein [Allisonella histaminiformans]